MTDKIKHMLERASSLHFQEKVMLWLYPVLLIIPNVLLCFTENTELLSKSANVVLPFGFFLLLMSLSVFVGRTLLLTLPLMMYAAFQIVLLYLYGESIIATDMLLSVVTSNPAEAGELLGNLMAAIIVIFVLYLPPIVWATVAVIKKAKIEKSDLKMPRNIALTLLVAGALLLSSCYIFIPRYSISREIFPVNVMRNTVEAVHRTYLTNKYPVTSDEFSYDASSKRKDKMKEIFVLVIGETSRADNWQLLGYERQTNPMLAKRTEEDNKGNLVAFKKVLTESNTTHKTVPLLLSYLEADEYGDSIYNTKSVISAFNEAGFSTAYFSTQRHNHSFIDYFSEEADVVHFLVDEGKPQLDNQLFEALSDYVSRAKGDKLFIVLHAYGSHFNYRDRYTDDCSWFKSDDYLTANAGNRAQLINAYDNSIRYTDKVLDNMITLLENQHCVSTLVYLSDHGEDIFDDERERFLHSSPTPTYYQLHVPLLVWMSDEMIDEFPEMHHNLESNKDMDVASTQAVFHTLLDMGGIDTKYYNPQKSLFSTKYSEPERRFINDYNEAVPLAKSGLKNVDFKKFAEWEIAY